MHYTMRIREITLIVFLKTHLKCLSALFVLLQVIEKVNIFNHSYVSGFWYCHYPSNLFEDKKQENNT